MGRGFSLIELLTSVLIITVAILGTMTASVGAGRIARLRGEGPDYTEAVGCAQESLEWYRNAVAADDTRLKTDATGLWKAGTALSSCGSGTESIQFEPGSPPVTPAHVWCLQPQDCDLVNGAGDCYSMQVRVCWDGDTCPSPGTPCT
jgi:prepilin-type N-terminal cleavage/methylation domain-containing protein